MLYRRLLGSIFLATVLCGSELRAATWYVAPGGAGDGLSAATPFGTINDAWLKVSAGDTIELAGGTYAGEHLGRRSGSANFATNVTIRPTAGQTASIVGTVDSESGVGHITFDGLTFNGQLNLNTVYGNFVIQNSTFRGSATTYLVDSALRIRTDNVLVQNNLITDYYGADGIVAGQTKAGNTRGSNVTITGNTIRNIYNNTGDPADAIHEDGIQFYDINNLTITNNRIYNVSNSSIIDSPGANYGIAHVLIQNNFLRKMDGNGENGYGVLNLLFSGDLTDLKVLNNTVLSDVHVTNNAEILLRNNIIDRYQTLGALVLKDHNLIGSKASGITLDPTEILGVLPTFVDPVTGDLHIADANLTSVAWGSSLLAPFVDYDGQVRYGTIWLGADQAPEPSMLSLGTLFLLKRRRRGRAR